VRDLLHYIHEELEKSNNKIVYIDTDALFIKDGTDLLNYLNSLIQAWGFDRYGHENVSVRFEYDGVYTKLLLIALCRYKGFIKKGDKIEEDITGIEAKRADSSKFMGEFQNKLLDIIMDGTPRNDVVLWIESQKQYIKTLPLTDIAFPCKMNNEASSYKSVPIFVRAAENSKTLFNYYPDTGTPFLYVPVKLKLKDKNNKYMDVLAFDEDNLEFINSDVIDWDSVIEKNITNKITKIFESMKWELPNGFSNYVDLF
jgi:DNA polymerase elongation subunit (family B)